MRVRLPSSSIAAPLLVVAIWGTLHATAAPLPGPEESAAAAGPEAFCTADDTWESISAVDGPASGVAGSLWTGSLWLVWDAVDPVGGHRYDPETDTWSPVSTLNAPGLYSYKSVWTGREVLFFGQNNGVLGGGRYDPATDMWNSLSSDGAPYPYFGYSVVWTGNQMIVWGGRRTGEAPINTGARYDPVSDTWTPMSTVGAPSHREEHSAVWTASRMIIWGGYVRHLGVSFRDGASYDPATDTWEPISEENAPIPRSYPRAVWTGDHMIIWGGATYEYLDRNTGGIYDPATDTWTSITPPTTPTAPHGIAAWTGGELIVWGAPYDPDAAMYFSGGSRYDPSNDTWTPMATSGGPESRFRFTADWTGTHYLVWGGYQPGSLPLLRYETGFRYSVGHNADQDGDGFAICDGDCDDSDPTSYPGAAELCDGRDNDCDGTLSPAEADADGAPGCADCDDANPLRFPGGLEYCDNLDNDCDDTVDGFSTSCGVGACASVGFCVAGADSCFPGTPTPEVCDGIDNDCDGLPGPGEEDGDFDGFGTCLGDCDIYYGLTFPGAPEHNDGLDNQCAGEPGFGLVDEITGNSGFHNPTDPTEYSWPAQAGAMAYLVARSTSPDFSSDCVAFPGSSPFLLDPDVPLPGGVLHYLVRPETLNQGSWGENSLDIERTFACGS